MDSATRHATHKGYGDKRIRSSTSGGSKRIERGGRSRRESDRARKARRVNRRGAGGRGTGRRGVGKGGEKDE